MTTRLLQAVWIVTLLLALTPFAASAQNAANNKAADAGPVRLAWFSYVQGKVTWRAGDDAAWTPASVNLPIRQGAQISVTGGGRAEVQLDDGSLLRLGGGSVATLQTLYSDQDGEFTELNLSEGALSAELRDSPSIYQINTPFVSVLSEGPSKVRVGAESSVEVAVRLGRATVERGGAKTTLSPGGYLNVPSVSSAFAIHLMPDEDSFDRFSDDRDRQLADPETQRRLPPDIARVAGNLDAYGAWHDDPHYGAVWSPRETDASWRPYQHGNWVWVEPFGWTWVSSEAWGWAPYHYGTWVREPYGWAWVPGPAQQPWCPGVVGFSESGDEVAWAPLAPSEVHYPVYLAHCYDGGDWADFFSIGGAAVYYPDDGGSCDPHPIHAPAHGVAVTPTIPGIFRQQGGGTIVNRYLHPPSGIHPNPIRFIPANARRYPGVTVARKAEFGEKGRSRPQAADGGAFWTRGREARAPESGASPVSGPISVCPAASSPSSLAKSSLPGGASGDPVRMRSVYRAPLPDRVARSAPPLPKASAPAASDTDAVTAKSDAPPPFVPPVFAPPVIIRPVIIRPVASGGARQNAPEARPNVLERLPTPPASVRRAEPGPIRIIVPHENALPREPRQPEAPPSDRRESQPESRSAPRSEEHPQEPQHSQEPQRTQEPQHSPPASEKQETKSDAKKDDAGEQTGRGGGRAR